MCYVEYYTATEKKIDDLELCVSVQINLKSISKKIKLKDMHILLFVKFKNMQKMPSI